jgi:plasmid replication initiation protein
MTDKANIQGDLFTFDSPLMSGVQGERSLMAFPFFALAKTAWTKPLIYKTDLVSIEIGPGPKGIATIYDKEILLYIASLMVAKIDEGQPVSQDFYFTANDLFRVTGVNSSSRSYNRLSDALERLQGTQIKTDIEAGGEGESGFFSWLESAKLHYTKNKEGERRLKSVRVRLCDWLFRAILRDRHVLEYAPAYFQLGPVERRLYEVARSSCVDGPKTTTLEELRLQLGYQSAARQFKVILKGVIENNTIPGFTFSIEKPAPTNGVASRKVDAEIVRIVPNANASRTAGHRPADQLIT